SRARVAREEVERGAVAKDSRGAGVVSRRLGQSVVIRAGPERPQEPGQRFPVATGGCRERQEHVGPLPTRPDLLEQLLEESVRPLGVSGETVEGGSAQTPPA